MQTTYTYDAEGDVFQKHETTITPVPSSVIQNERDGLAAQRDLLNDRIAELDAVLNLKS